MWSVLFLGLKVRVKEHFWKFAMLQLRSEALKHLLVKASHIVKPKGNSVEIYILSTGRFLQSQDKGCGCMLLLQGRRKSWDQ